MNGKAKNLPAKACHVPAALLAVLLTIALFATQLGLIAIQMTGSRSLHLRVALDDATVQNQMNRIAEDVRELAAEKNFSADPVIAAVSREIVEALDREVVAWWTDLARTGELTEAPGIHVDLGETLQADGGFIGGLNPLTVNGEIESIESRVDQMIRKSAVLFRDQLLQAGLQRVGGSLNLPMMTELLQKLPGLGGLAGLLLAGLIALIMSRKIQTAGQYIGGAFSACGLLMLTALALMKSMNIGSMIGEASSALQSQYSHLARIISTEVIAGAVFAMVIGGLLMTLAVKVRRKAA